MPSSESCIGFQLIENACPSIETRVSRFLVRAQLLMWPVLTPKSEFYT